MLLGLKPNAAKILQELRLLAQDHEDRLSLLRPLAPALGDLLALRAHSS